MPVSQLKQINKPLISIILPCRNEEQSLAQSINSIRKVLDNSNLTGEIIVSDSSNDHSPDIARQFADKLVKHDKEGYGLAYLEGFEVAVGEILFLADPDGSYDFGEIPRFVNEVINKDYDFIIGNRFQGKIHPGAMPFLHQKLGSPILTHIFRYLYQLPIGVINCGMRAIKHSLLPKLELSATGMEFASEMLIKASRHNLKIKELPIDYYPRLGDSKLRTFPDGWRHFKLMINHKFAK